MAKKTDLKRREILKGMPLALLAVGCLPEEEERLSSEELELGPQASASEINSALARGLVVRLLEGTYRLTEPLVLPSGARIYGAGSELTRIIPTWAVGAGRDDDSTNAVILIAGAVSSSEIDRLQEHTSKGARTTRLESGINAKRGTWLRIRGHNGVGDEHEMSDGTDVILQELVRIDEASGRELSLDVEMMQHHVAGTIVDRVKPVFDVHLEGIELAASGTAIAVGVSVSLAFDVTIVDIVGSGFSRTMFDLRDGTRQIRIEDIKSEGENNAIVLGDSVVDLVVSDVDTTSTGARCHPRGVPRGLISFRNRSSAVQVRGATLQHACVGLRTWGGRGIRFADVLIRDMDGDEAYVRDPEIAGGLLGVGVDGGAGPLPIAEFAQDISFASVHIEDCRTSSLAQAAWYLHDIWGVVMNGCTIINKGASPTVEPMNGILMSDCSGVADVLLIQGVNYPIRTRNVMTYVAIDTLVINGAAGAGYGGTFAIHLDHGGGAGSSPRIRRLETGNTSGHTRFGEGFTSAPDWQFSVGSLAGDVVGTNALAAMNASDEAFAVGEVVTVLETDGQRQVVSAEISPTSKRAVVVTGAPYDYGTGLMLVAMLPTSRGRVLCTEDAVNVGDLLVSDGESRRARVDNAPTNPYAVLGRAQSSKLAGEQGLVDVGNI